MYNILPNIHKKATSKRVDQAFYRDWEVAKADPKTAVIPPYIASEFTPDPQDLIKYRISKANHLEPNHVPTEVLAQLGPSPLDQDHRGQTDPVISNITIPTTYLDDLTKTTYRPPKLSKAEDLVVCIQSDLLTKMDVYIQRSSAIRNYTLQTGEQCIRCVNIFIYIHDIAVM
jgi:hypothetical protein